MPVTVDNQKSIYGAETCQSILSRGSFGADAVVRPECRYRQQVQTSRPSGFISIYLGACHMNMTIFCGRRLTTATISSGAQAISIIRCNGNRCLPMHVIRRHKPMASSHCTLHATATRHPYVASSIPNRLYSVFLNTYPKAKSPPWPAHSRLLPRCRILCLSTECT